jgi:hypothetical protein
MSSVYLAQPDACVGRTDRLVYDADQVSTDRIELDLVAQARAEGINGAGRVVAGTIEAPIDGLLDPPT